MTFVIQDDIWFNIADLAKKIDIFRLDRVKVLNLGYLNSRFLLILDLVLLSDMLDNTVKTTKWRLLFCFCKHEWFPNAMTRWPLLVSMNKNYDWPILWTDFFLRLFLFFLLRWELHLLLRISSLLHYYSHNTYYKKGEKNNCLSKQGGFDRHQFF